MPNPKEILNKARLDWAHNWLKTPKKFYAGGSFLAPQGKTTWKVVNPSSEEVLCEVPVANEADVNVIVKAAGDAFQAGCWPESTRRFRREALIRIGNLIREHAEELATLESLCNGKLFSESLIDDVPESADVFDYYAGWIDKLYGDTVPVDPGFINYTRKEPVGVCALIVPWNFPLLLACWKIAPALAMGNTVIVKPSEYTPLSILRLCEIIHEKANLPRGVFNVVMGDAETGRLISEHPGIHKVSFTGSTVVGKKVLMGAAQSNLKTVTLELGGKSPNILFADLPDLEAAIERSCTAMFSHKGEKCSEPTRILIEDSIYDKVVAALGERANRIKLGDAFEEGVDQGPQAHQAHFKKVLDYIEIGKKEGAKLVCGGVSEQPNKKGFFVRPTIFSEVKPEMRIAQEEIFGPVLVAIRFKTEEEAIRIANQTPYGLAAGLWTSDLSRAHRVAAKLDSGMVFVNRYGCYDFASPFGGFKQSGWGKEMAIHSLDAYTKTKSVWIKL
ncbi:MAG: aldehyde dehydrogenase family protein [Proteobacteria bacterium]|nr:aldehyde dehydrogenase family protein [Pseudomonadota bacterium]